MALSLSATLMGCATTPMGTAIKNSIESMKRRPNRMIVGMAPNYIERDGFPFHQGLLVRAHFFLNDEPIPMKVEGTMRFVAYDKAKVGDGEPQPVGIYTIATAEMPNHLRKDIIGESYVFWLPYEPEVHTQIIVNASFTPTYGEQYTSEPATVHLTPLKHTLAAENGAEKRRPRPNYVPFDSVAPKQTATVSTIPMNNKPRSISVKTIGGATPANAGALGKQAIDAAKAKETNSPQAN